MTENQPSSVLGDDSSVHEPSQRSSQQLAAGLKTAVDAGVCLFTVGGRQFALDTSTVGEVIAADSYLPVPMSPGPVIGLFNLRGTPVAIIDLLAVLGEPKAAWGDKKSVSLLVLRTEQTIGALRVDRLDAVLPAGRGQRVMQPAGTHEAVVGFFEPEQGGRGAVLLGAPELIQSLIKLGFQDNDERRSFS